MVFSRIFHSVDILRSVVPVFDFSDSREYVQVALQGVRDGSQSLRYRTGLERHSPLALRFDTGPALKAVSIVRYHMVQQGHTAVVHVVGRLVDGPDAGEVFETTDVDVALDEGIYHNHRDYKPLEFRVGSGAVLDGIDDAVREMSVGETRTVRLEPDEAFGEYDDERVGEVPRTELVGEGDSEPETGALIRNEAGETGWIAEVDEETVTVDFNHELADEPVAFEIRLLDAEKE